MLLIIQHLLIFLQISAVCLVISINGFLFKKFFLGETDNKNFEENGIFGFVFIGFIALLINFFSSLNILVSNLFFILSLLVGYKLNFFNLNFWKLIKKLFFVTVIAYIFIIYSNVNRPDAFLYHLPYSKIVNENKIILGLSNLHHRFGHISIYQYISSIFNNTLLSSNGILIPISLLPSYFFIYCYKRLKKDFKNTELKFNSYIVFIFLIISIYSFNRYSGWGNDAQAHIYYFLSIIYFLDTKINRKHFDKLMISCLFTFLIKPFYLISLLLPFVFFIFSSNKIRILKSKIFIFLFIFSCLWFFKNFLISSCLIYPINITCIENTSWYNKEDISRTSIEGEGWAKDWGNRKKEYNALKFEDYVSNFKWVKTWLNNHFKVVVEKVSPVIIFLILNIMFFYFSKCLKKTYQKEDDYFLILLFIINSLGFFAWFSEFPIYRYGLSNIYTFLILALYFIIFNRIDLVKIIKFKIIFMIIIYIGFTGIFVKNLFRILKTENKNIYPTIYDGNNNGEVVKVYNSKGKFIHYKNTKGLCGYSKSPCRFIDVDINKDMFFGYIVFK